MGKKVTSGRTWFIRILIFLTTCLVLISLDIFARFLYAKTWFGNTTVSTEVDPFDIISLIITTAVTLWLGWYVSKKITEQRYEKEYLIDDLKDIEGQLKLIEKEIQLPNINLQSVLDLLNKLRVYIDRFSKTTEIFKLSKIDCGKLNTFHSQLFGKLTNVDGDTINSADLNNAEINQLCGQFIIEARDLIAQINKR